MSAYFQERYKLHRARKAYRLLKPSQAVTMQAEPDYHTMLEKRTSIRRFKSIRLATHWVQYILREAAFAPSSCNRRAIEVQVVRDTPQKRRLDATLRGGVGWIGDASVILLLFAAKEAYRSPGEIEFMPYLDAGVIAATMLYSARSYGIGACFVNPSIQEGHEGFFREIAGVNASDYIFCGAIALGEPAEDETPQDNRTLAYSGPA